MKRLKRFTGDPPEFRNKLNDVVDAVNRLLNIRGGALVDVQNMAAGVTIDLGLNRLLSRIPKSRAEAAFLCLVTKDGGVSGGAAAMCTYTYTIMALDDTTVLPKNNALDAAEAMVPERPRLHNVRYFYSGQSRGGPLGVTSRYALAAYDDEGDLHLLVCYGEIADNTACP